MKKQDNRSDQGRTMDRNDQPKGEQYQTAHKGGPSVSHKDASGHEKDDSSKGADRNTTKKGANAV